MIKYIVMQKLAAQLSEATEITINIQDRAKQSFHSQIRRPFLVAVIDPHNIPANAVDVLGDYGSDKLTTLLDYYHGTDLELDRLQNMQEWQMLCSIFTTNQHLQTLPDVVSFFCNSGIEGTLPQLKALAIDI